MKYSSKHLMTTFWAILGVFTFSSATFALQSTGAGPDSKAGVPPYGVTAQENASGAKLIGVVHISFTNHSCNEDWEPQSGDCLLFGPNAADAKMTMRLMTTSSGKESITKTLFVDIGQVPIFSISAIQNKAMTAARSWIINGFFDGDCDEDTPVNCSQEIYVKEFTNYSEANISTAPPDYPYADFSFIADILLAVD